jgi:hypothetical protein
VTIEDELRRVLSDPRYALESWPEAAGQVRAGVVRRRRRRRLALGSGVVTFAVLAATVLSVILVRGPAAAPPTGPDRTPSPSAESGEVAWRDLPTAPEVAPTLSPRPPTTPCRAADLVLDGVETEGAAGTLYHVVQVHNAGRSRCTLGGRPALLRKDSHTIRATPVSPVEQADPGATPATIDPGERAEVRVLTYGGCLDGRPETTYTDVRLRVTGGQLRLRTGLNVTCGVGVEEWHRPAPSPAPDRLAPLTITIGAPASVRVGQTLAFVVVLGNPTGTDIPLDPCPNYLVYLTSPAKIAHGYQLNCAVPAIPAHRSVRFAMRLPITPLAPAAGGVAGPTTLVWQLQAGDLKQATTPVTVLDG